MNNHLKYTTKDNVNDIIDKNYSSIFDSTPDIEYIASVPKSIENPNDDEYYIEVGLTNSKTDYIPLICNDGTCIIQSQKEISDTDHFSKYVFVNSFNFQTQKSKERPLKYGINIANQYHGFGTLGAIVQVAFGNRKSPSKFILSNHHVLCGPTFVKDRFISQPHQAFCTYGFHPKDIIAQVKYGHMDDEVDVALAKLFDVDHNLEMYLSNEQAPIGLELDTNINVGQKIYKIGASTGKTEGIIRSKNAYVRTKPYKTAKNKVTFKKQLLFDDISKNGDSGSLVLINTNGNVKAIGLLVGGDNRNYSIANNMKFIFSNKKRYKELPAMKFLKFI